MVNDIHDIRDGRKELGLFVVIMYSYYLQIIYIVLIESGLSLTINVCYKI